MWHKHQKIARKLKMEAPDQKTWPCAGIASLKKNRNTSVGSTLVEAIVSIGVFASISGGLAAVFWNGTMAGEESRRRTTASSITRGLMEAYSDWTSLDLLDGNANGTVTNGTYSSAPPAAPPIAPVTLNNVTYTPTVIIANGPLGPARLKDVRITVSCSTRTITLRTLKADY